MTDRTQTIELCKNAKALSEKAQRVAVAMNFSAINSGYDPYLNTRWVEKLSALRSAADSANATFAAAICGMSIEEVVSIMTEAGH